MEYFIAGCAGVGAVALWCVAAFAAIEADNKIVKILCALFCFLSLGWLAGQTAKNEAEHPCISYETRMTYNAATKTMMPLRVCTERGEWVKP